MEIRISALEGVRVPDDCIVNVSVGDVQKQARYDPKKLYRFKDPKRVAKIDLYQQIGSCDISWNIDEPASVSCVAKGSSSSGIPLNVNVAPVVAKEKAAVKAEKSDASLKARQYLKQHAVEELLTKAMRELLKVMPDDAHQFLADFISNRGVMPPPVTPATAPSGAHPTHAAATAVPVGSDVCTAAPKMTTSEQTAQDPLSRIRAQACGVLMKASMDGTLNNVLTDIVDERSRKGGDEPCSTIDSRVLQALQYERDALPGVVDTRTVLSRSQEVAPVAANTRMTPSSNQGDPQSKTKDLAVLRYQAADVLMKASADGSLQDVLKEIRLELAPTEKVSQEVCVNVAPQCKDPPQASVQPEADFVADIQIRLQQTLEAACDSGKLEAALNKVFCRAEHTRDKVALDSVDAGASLTLVTRPPIDNISLGMSLPMLFI